MWRWCLRWSSAPSLAWVYTFSYDVLAVVNALRAALPPKSLTDFQDTWHAARSFYDAWRYDDLHAPGSMNRVGWRR